MTICFAMAALCFELVNGCEFKCVTREGLKRPGQQSQFEEKLGGETELLQDEEAQRIAPAENRGEIGQRKAADHAARDIYMYIHNYIHTTLIETISTKATQDTPKAWSILDHAWGRRISTTAVGSRSGSLGQLFSALFGEGLGGARMGRGLGRGCGVERLEVLFCFFLGLLVVGELYRIEFTPNGGLCGE